MEADEKEVSCVSIHVLRPIVEVQAMASMVAMTVTMTVVATVGVTVAAIVDMPISEAGE